MIDDQDDDLILSMSRLGFSKQSSLLGCCKVPYGCQAHLSAIMKVVCSCKMMKVTKMMKVKKEERKPTLPAASGFSAPAGATYRELSLANFSTWTATRKMKNIKVLHLQKKLLPAPLSALQGCPREVVAARQEVHLDPHRKPPFIQLFLVGFVKQLFCEKLCFVLHLADNLLLGNDPLHLPLKVGHRTKRRC